MKPWIKRIIILYLIIVFLKISLSYFIFAPSAFSDDYGFVKTARSIFYYQDITAHGEISTRPPLYSIFLSPAYIFKDMGQVYLFMKIINALISSMTIFPIWLLSKEFFNPRKASLLTIIAAVLPAHFIIAFFLMAENLFYPLFLFSIYFIYKSFITKGYKWDIIAGIFIGLAYLTKITALILPLIVIFVLLLKLLKKDYGEIYKKIIMILSFLITILPWAIRNGLLLGFNKNMLLGSYGRTLEVATSSLGYEFIIIFLIWFILCLGYLMIASGFIFFISNLFTFKEFDDQKVFVFSFLTFFSIILLVCLASRAFKLEHAVEYTTIFPQLIGRPIGRYMEVVLPLIFINGLLGFKHFKVFSKIILGPIIILLFSSQLIFFPMFPVNNMSLTWLGVLKFIMDFLIYKVLTFQSIFSIMYTVLFIMIFIALFLLTVYLKNRLSIKKLLYLFIIFFSLVSLLNFIVVYYNSYTFWYKGEQMQLGLWFNKYDPGISTVLFDERDGCKIFKTNQTCIYNPFMGGGFATVIGFWMNDELKVGPVNDLKGVDYIISRHKLDLRLLKETKNGIFLYEVKQRNEL